MDRFICLPLIVLFPLFASAGGAKAPPSIKPDADLQAVIKRAIHSGPVDKEAALNTLKELARTKAAVVAPQLIYFSMHAQGEREGWGSLGLMIHLGKMWDTEMRQALIPLLEINDEKSQRVVFGWLAGIDGHARPTTEATVQHYREALSRQKAAPPPTLVRYVFQLNPGQAALLYEDIYLGQVEILNRWPRTMLWSDHLITTVRWRQQNFLLQDGDLEKAHHELNTLSKQKEWYARRYVVEIIAESPKLGTPELLSRLRKDADPLVSGPAKAIR